MVTPATVERALITLLGRVPTSVIIALLSVLIACRIAPVLQQIVATLVALFSNDPQRANRAIRILRTLREMPNLQKDNGTPRIARKSGEGGRRRL